MRNFNQGGGSRFGGSSRGGNDRRPSFGDRGPVTMHPAVCSSCGKSCEVPFRPTGDKPIYCNDCFGASKDRGGSSFSPRSNDRGGDRGSSAGSLRGGDRFPRKDFSPRAPMRPSFGGGNGDEVKKQLEFLGLKIDRLTKIVENLSGSKPGMTKEKSAEVKEVLKKVTKKTAVKKAVKKVKV